MSESFWLTDAAHGAMGFVAGNYLQLVRATTRFLAEPIDLPEALRSELPVIIAMWHGQHFMVFSAWPKGAPVRALVSRHSDAEINARALRWLGIGPIRGSGGPAQKMRKRGGPAALREMVRTLASGTSVALTADVPKHARVAGAGIVALAQISGRPIFPLAVVTGPRIDLPSWDRASFALPGGRGAMVLGSPIRAPRVADQGQLERARLAVQAGLDEAHRRAYALIGSDDPGAALNRGPA